MSSDAVEQLSQPGVPPADPPVLEAADLEPESIAPEGDSGSDTSSEALLGALRDLTAAVHREHERAGAREAVIDRLHDENQAMRRDQLDSMLEPVRNGLFRLHEALRREVTRWSLDIHPEVASVSDLFDAFADDVSELLERTGLETFSAARGERFDPVRHHARSRVDIDDPALDARVLDMTAGGFVRGDRVVRRAEVVVGRCRPTENQQ